MASAVAPTRALTERLVSFTTRTRSTAKTNGTRGAAGDAVWLRPGGGLAIVLDRRRKKALTPAPAATSASTTTRIRPVRRRRGPAWNPGSDRPGARMGDGGSAPVPSGG